MSGHSHWATIRRKKEAVDAKKGKVFSKIARAIMAAARQGGADPNANIRLKALMEEARACRMPRDSIERAAKKGAGELPGEQLEEIVYEAYGPGGVALVIEVLTDNRNRTAAELRKLMDVYGGTMDGSTAWMFEPKGLITVQRENAEEDSLFELAVEAGAEDMEAVGDVFQITCEVGEFEGLKAALEQAEIPVESAQITKIPKTNLPLDEAAGRKILKLMETLDDHDDIQNVYANFDLPEGMLAEETAE